MNLILFSKAELQDATRLRVDFTRAEHLLAGGKMEVGRLLRVGEQDGKLGVGRVTEVAADHLWLDVTLDSEAQLPPTIDLILALPRPQMMKRILHVVACLGVRKLFLIGSERVEKSYFSSSVLNAESIEHCLRLGLEQGVGTRVPQVQVEPKMFSFFEEHEESIATDFPFRLIADSRAELTLDEITVEKGLAPADPVVVAIGPEGGWKLHELRAFESRRFSSFHLGARVLSVELAVSVLLGQIQLLRELARKRN